MSGLQAKHIVVIGAGAAGLMAARELARAGKRVTILEARDRCGGRICPLPVTEFGYPAEAGAEFIHGDAPVTHALLREAGLAVRPTQGTRWNVQNGTLTRNELSNPHLDRLHERLAGLTTDATVTAFLAQQFPGPEYAELRQFVLRMVQGYDAADPDRASILAVRDEWMGSGRNKSSRIVGGYGALIDFLAADCRKLGVAIHLRAVVTAIERSSRQTQVRCAGGDTHVGDIAILTVPLALLPDIVLPPAVREKAAAAADIGYGNVIKFLFRFRSRWWASVSGQNLSDLSFLRSGGIVPVWWTQNPAEHPVLTGWLAGPPSQRLAHLDGDGLVAAGVASLADAFGFSPKQLADDLVAVRAIDWAKDPFARGGYSYITPETRAARATLESAGAHGVLFAGEALYGGEDMGIVEAALASGRDTARLILVVPNAVP
jgi:monoamine oxidase